MNDTIDIRLRYVVTGSVETAKRALQQAYRPANAPLTLGGVLEPSNDYYEARCLSVDINPDRVSGYSNYETFTVALFLENNRDPYDQMRSLSLQALNMETESTDPNAHSEAVVWLADALEQLVEETYLGRDQREMACRTDTDRLAFGLLTAALERVDWIELAQCYLDSAKEG